MADFVYMELNENLNILEAGCAQHICDQNQRWLGKGYFEMLADARDAQIQLLLEEHNLTVENMRDRGYTLIIESRDGMDFVVLAKVETTRLLPTMAAQQITPEPEKAE